MSLGNFLIFTGFLLVGYAFFLTYKKLVAVSHMVEKYKTVLDEVEDGYFELDLYGICKFATNGLSRIFGSSVEDFKGTDFRDVMTREDAEKIYKKFNSIFKTGEPCHELVAEVYSGYGKKVLLEFSVAPLVSKKGRVEGFKGIAKDATYKIKLEKALKKAQEEALSAKELKTSFLGNISHEIKTPMSGVIGMAKLLNKTELSEDQKKQVDIIIKSSEILFKMINDILDFSKIESGKLLIKKQPFDLRGMVLDVKKYFNNDVKEKDLKLNFEIDASVPEVMVGDELRIQQILTNIISNSVKFTLKGGVKIKVWVEFEKGKNFINFSVSDTGPGISKKDLNIIFDNFTKADNSKSKQYGGTGLGLAITKELVSLMGGRIRVRSELGKGTIFKVSIPFIDYDQAKIYEGKKEIFCEKTDNSVVEIIENWLDSNNKDLINVLIVDDNKVNIEVIQKHFLRLPMRIDTCENGYEALEKVLNKEFDLIIMDVQMPGMDGIKTVRKLRVIEKESQRKSVPIIAVTAHTTAEDMEECFSCGMNAYLSKPVEAEELHNAVACSLALSSRLN